MTASATIGKVSFRTNAKVERKGRWKRYTAYEANAIDKVKRNRFPDRFFEDRSANLKKSIENEIDNIINKIAINTAKLEEISAKLSSVFCPSLIEYAPFKKWNTKDTRKIIVQIR
jgi:hypothetical protein